MIPHTIQTHLADAAKHHPNARVFALVDGVQYQQETGNRLVASDPALLSLFAGTEYEPLAHAGPWLVSMESDHHANVTAQLEQLRPSVVWLISIDDAPTLAASLRQRLKARLPDDQEIMLRFWDPRALNALAASIPVSERAGFFGATLEWHYLLNNQRVCIKSHASV